jgi:acyl-[acyl-carrier-protein]-phospholipid O-acyltransferase/long-chain-fatty-acid--[acyl-carrier-protein] ligase
MSEIAQFSIAFSDFVGCWPAPTEGGNKEVHTATSTYRETLRRPGLQPFLWTQFLGAFNDNLFKIVVSMLVVQGVTAASAGRNLSLVGGIFILPFLLFSGYAGQLADVYSKRSVLIITKSLEIVATTLGLLAFLLGRLELMYAVLFLIALQATFFSPAKYGILPEVLPDRDLSRANGLLEMSTFVAIVAGTAIGSFLFDVWKDRLWMIGVVVLGVALGGTASSFGIPRVAAAAPGTRIRVNPWGEIADGLTRLRRDRVLWLTVIGISYFWFLGALLQLVMVLFGGQVLKLDDRWIGLLTACAAVGIGLGSLVAGRLSGDKVELGLAPIGSIGMGVFAIVLSRCTHSFWAAAFNLAVVGFFGGLFAVPLNALLQQRSGGQEKGRLMATNNFLNMVAILFASGALWLCSDGLGLTPDRIILTFGVLTLLSSVYVLSVVPEFLIRFSLWLLTHTLYRIRIVGQEHVPFRGPALLVCNHMAHIDGLLVGSCVQRFIRFMVDKPYYEHTALNWLMRLMKAIPVAASPAEAAATLERAREELRHGHVVCIFAEGAISRTGNLLPFTRGFERIVEGLDVPVIPVYLDQVRGSVFSFRNGRFVWKWPTRIPYSVTVTFGAPLSATATAAQVRQAILELGTDAVSHRFGRGDLLHLRFLRTARRRWFSFAMADSSGRELTYGKALAGSLALARRIRDRCRDERMVGIMLPASVGGALANIATLLAGKVPVNLNFTAGSEAIASAVEQCRIGTVLTSRVFLAKAKLAAPDGACFLEDVMKDITLAQRLGMLAVGLLLPSRVIEWLFVGGDRHPDTLATVIFSSGSTGVPKGVMLSHRNIVANLEGIAQVYWVVDDDRLMGVLPFFHSFGFTGSLWLPLVTGFGVVYHANPMDAGTIGEMVQKHRATMIISTPTFCLGYARKCSAEQFATLRYSVVGAEKLREPIARAFKEKYGLDLLEGYGCTEMGPVVSVNAPDYPAAGQKGMKAGTVGHPLPGVAAKVVDRETGQPVEPGTEGLLLVKGANRMLGYLDAPEKTRDVLREGWYVTGDIATIDEDGFIRLTDRVSRFSKIAGEMVPHVKIEETITQMLGDFACVVTAIPDESKGERLVAFYTSQEVSPAALWSRLGESNLPKLWIPKRENLHYLDVIPLLGSGKVDLKRVRELALERAGGGPPLTT